MGGITLGTWTENVRPAWAAEGISPDKLMPGGAKVNPSEFLAEDGATVTLTANANGGATSLAVSALANAIPSGTLLDFGVRAAHNVVVGAAGASGGATSVPVDALTAPLASGTLLDFGTNKFARLTAAAALGATSITVAAIPTALVDNDSATVPAVSIIARTTANAAAAATSITVEALAEPILSGDVATYAGAGTLKKRIQAGTLLGRTYTERDAGTGYGRWTTGDHEVYLVPFEITDAVANPNVELAAHTLKVYENNLPEWSGSSSDFKAAVRANYPTMLAPAG